jgi:uncharacterized protein (DUF924 family)
MTAADVLDFWFQGDPTVWRTDPWFRKNSAFDEEIRVRFGEAVAQAQAGAWEDWSTHPSGALALLLLLDQFARNLHRGNAQAFAGDARALRTARAAVAAGFDLALTPIQRVFLYLPFEHSETDQDESVRLFESLPSSDWPDGVVQYAHQHRAVIQQFGRFPHRNAALGRVSTPEEVQWLAAGGGF